MQVSPNGKPDGPDQSVRCDLLMRVLDGGLRESDESACLDLGRILDVFGVSPGHCPRCEVGQRGDVEFGIGRFWKQSGEKARRCDFGKSIPRCTSTALTAFSAACWAWKHAAHSTPISEFSTRFAIARSSLAFASQL